MHSVLNSFRQKLTINSQYSMAQDFFASIFEITGNDRNVIIPRNMERATRYSIFLWECAPAL